MILYFAVTTYQILTCVLHKMKYHPDESTTFLIPKGYRNFSNFKNKLIENNFCQSVIGVGEYSTRGIPLPNSTKEIDNYIRKKVEFVESNFPIDIENYSNIYVCADHYSFGIYLVYKGIKYNFFEEASGRLSTSDSIFEHIQKFDPIQLEIIKKLGLFGFNDYVIQRFGDLNKQKKKYYNKKDVHFSVPEILASLDNHQLSLIRDLFEEQQIKTNCNNSKSALLLTQHYINLNLMTFKEQQLLYYFLVDYFLAEKKIFIKIHPADSQGLYHKWFPRAEILDRQLPAELLPYILEEKFDIGITASSTSIYNLSNAIDNIVCFTQQIEKTFKSMNKYFTTLKLIELIPSENKKEIFTYGINIKQLEELARHYKIKLPKITNLEEEKFPIKKKSRLFIIDDFYFVTNPRESFTDIRKNLNEDDLIIYLNSEDKNLCFYPNDKTFDKTVIPIVIEKENIKDEYNTEFIDKETMFTITHNKEITEIAKNLKFEKDLKYTGIKIIVDQNNNYKRKYLESKLAVIDTNIIEIAKNYLILKDDNSRQEKRIDKTLNSKSWQITRIFRNLSKKVQKHYEKK